MLSFREIAKQKRLAKTLEKPEEPEKPDPPKRKYVKKVKPIVEKK